jgi:hypothetical protein
VDVAIGTSQKVLWFEVGLGDACVRLECEECAWSLRAGERVGWRELSVALEAHRLEHRTPRPG